MIVHSEYVPRLQYKELRRRPCEEDKYFQFPKNFHFQPSDIFYRLGKDLSLLNCLIAYCLGAVTLRGAGDRPAVVREL